MKLAGVKPVLPVAQLIVIALRISKYLQMERQRIQLHALAFCRIPSHGIDI